MTSTHLAYLGRQRLQPRKGQGTIACQEKAPPDQNRRRPAGGQGKACMVNATLREAQIRSLFCGHDASTVVASCCGYRDTAQNPGKEDGNTGWPSSSGPTVQPASRENDRKGHLTTPNLIGCVNTGSPKRACLTRPARRRSRHTSQMLGVTPETAPPKGTDMAETDRATGRGTPAIRVKDGTSAEFTTFRTTMVEVR